MSTPLYTTWSVTGYLTSYTTLTKTISYYQVADSDGGLYLTSTTFTTISQLETTIVSVLETTIPISNESTLPAYIPGVTSTPVKSSQTLVIDTTSFNNAPTASSSASVASSIASSQSSRIAAGAIAGIVIGVLAVLAIILSIFLFRRRQRKQGKKHVQHTPATFRDEADVSKAELSGSTVPKGGIYVPYGKPELEAQAQRATGKSSYD